MTRPHTFLKRTLLFSAVLTLLTCSLSASTGPTSAPRYTVTDLNIHVGASDSGPRAINVAGEIVGRMEKPNGNHVGFRYKDGVLTELVGLDGIESDAVAINNKSQIVGYIRLANRREVAVVWEDGKVRTIPPLTDIAGYPANMSPSISGINDVGRMIGSVPEPEDTFRSFVWQDGKAVGSPASPPAILQFLPTSINTSGQVVGSNHHSGLDGSNSWDHAMLWEKGKAQDLGTLPGGTISHAKAINDRGQVVGVSISQGNGDTTPSWMNHPFLWEDGKMRELGMPRNGKGSEAYAINNKGQVVGTAYIHYEKMEGNSHDNISATHAMLWMSGKPYDLNDLLPKDSDWVLERALAINDWGQIVGLGNRTKDENRHRVGGWRVFLLTPQ